MDDIDEDFKQMTDGIDLGRLLLLADKALCMMELVLDDIRETEIGDSYEYDGSMEAVDSVREAVSRYRGYLITGQG